MFTHRFASSQALLSQSGTSLMIQKCLLNILLSQPLESFYKCLIKDLQWISNTWNV